MKTSDEEMYRIIKEILELFLNSRKGATFSINEVANLVDIRHDICKRILDGMAHRVYKNGYPLLSKERTTKFNQVGEYSVLDKEMLELTYKYIYLFLSILYVGSGEGLRYDPTDTTVVSRYLSNRETDKRFKSFDSLFLKS
jgi:hypothetical protein